jgi:hypothetical protein
MLPGWRSELKKILATAPPVRTLGPIGPKVRRRSSSTETAARLSPTIRAGPTGGWVAADRADQGHGIDRALSTALALWRKPLAVRDSGKILLDLAIMLVLGGHCLADVNLLRCESGVFGGSPRIRRCRG